MLYLYQSNRLENLARVFTGLQKLMPPENPLAAEEIVVQSQGMRRFLNLHLAKELGVAANLNFSLPAGLTWRLILPVALVGIVGIASIVAMGDTICKPDVEWPGLREYQKHRVCTLLDPTSDPLGKGFHIIQSTIAIGSGGVFGKGWGRGTQTHLDFLPERHTDFIFAVLTEEFGLAGAIVLVLLYICLIFRGLFIAAGAPTLFSRLLAGALTLILFTYAFVNMGMVSGILPVVGVPLPFVSYGGTALVTLCLGVGMLMSIQRHRRRVGA